jgi:glycosyltransferase involved in cell wall biosynthesis
MRNAANIAALAALGPVTVVGIGDDGTMRSPLGELHAVGLGRRPVPDQADGWAERPGGHPSDSRWDERTDGRWRRLVAESRPDLVVVEQLWLHHAVPGATAAGAATVLDAHNVEAAVYAAIAANMPPAAGRRERRLAASMAERTAALERDVTASVDQVWACSELDAAAFRRVGADARVVPNAVDTDELWLRRPTRRAPNLVFPASFAYPPNVRAARLLVEEILPRFAERVAGGTLSLVGRDPPKWLRELGRRGQAVEVTGAVPSTTPWLERACAMVVPLEEGSGTRFKVLEALALGVPVVTTPKGIEGLDVIAGEHVLVGHVPGQLADHAARTYDVEPSELVAAGRALVEERYSWRAVAEAVRSSVRSLLGSRPVDRPASGT